MGALGIGVCFFVLMGPVAVWLFGFLVVWLFGLR